MQKICSSCGEERDTEKDFSWEYKLLGIRQSRCKYCQAELARLHYQKDKQTYKDRTRIRKNRILFENKTRLCIYLSNHPCVDCGETDIRVLEFDHVIGQKDGEISDLFRQGFSWLTIEAEIAKCEIRCANCHRIKTFSSHSNNWRISKDTQQQAKIYKQMRAYLSTHPCVDCHQADIRLLEFDHVRGHKTANISRLLTQGRNWPIIEAEIAKCEIRCANCHRKRTAERDGAWWRATQVE